MRAKNGKGTIVKKGNTFFLGIRKGKVNGRYIKKWIKLKAATPEAAETERDDINTDRRRNVFVEPSAVTVEKFAKVFLSDMNRAVNRGRIAKATYEWYEKRLRLHILPEIGGLKLTEVKKRDLQNLYDDLYEQSTSKAEGAYRILHRLWAVAIENDDLDIKYNLAEKIEHGEKEKYIPKVWTGKQITYFLHHAKERRYYELFLMGFGAGMRLGEILGLTWDCIDHKDMVIHVKRSITLNKVYDLENIETLLKKTKNQSSKRDIRMLPIVSDALKALKTKQVAEELQAKKYYKLELVFTTKDGRPVNYSNIRDNYWMWLIDQINNDEHPLPYIKLHGMRHSCATWLYDELEVPLEIIQDILGHAVPQTTKQMYVHKTVRSQNHAMELVNEKFKEAGL
jgi:integrase